MQPLDEWVGMDLCFFLMERTQDQKALKREEESVRKKRALL